MAGNKPKLIDEFVGRVNSRYVRGQHRPHAKSGRMAEPGQTPEFDEYTVVLRGGLQVKTKRTVLDVQAGQAVMTSRGE